jgi:antitoxin component YwqK of YwqJK toxin-antitoxin module
MAGRKKATAERIDYHKDGSVRARGPARDGVPVGYWEWFRKDGTKLRSGHFDDDGQQTGEWITYDQNGEVYKVTQMKRKAPER